MMYWALESRKLQEKTSPVAKALMHIEGESPRVSSDMYATLQQNITVLSTSTQLERNGRTGGPEKLFAASCWPL